MTTAEQAEDGTITVPGITGPNYGIAVRNAQAVAAKFYDGQPFVYLVVSDHRRFGDDGETVTVEVQFRAGRDTSDGWEHGDPCAAWGEEVDAPRSMRVTGELGKAKPPRPAPKVRPKPPPYNPWQHRVADAVRGRAQGARCALLGHPRRALYRNTMLPDQVIETCTRCTKSRVYTEDAGWGRWEVRDDLSPMLRWGHP